MKLTLLLIVLNLTVFLFTLPNLENYIDVYGFNASHFLAGNYHLLITSLFLHAGYRHIAGNMVALFFLGLTAEKNVKSWQFILVYFAAGVVANLSFLLPLFNPSYLIVAVGASGAISGIVGLGVFLFPRKFVLFPSIIPLPFIVAGAIYFLANATRLFANSHIAYHAHIFGLVAGALFGLVWGEERIKRLSVFFLLMMLLTGLPLMIGYF